MDERICFKCQKEFRVSPSRLGKYCSYHCSNSRPSTQKGKHFKPNNALDVWRQNGGVVWNFKGDSVGYNALHSWVSRKLGTPKVCSNCGDTESKRFHWANVSRQYKRILSDWVRLCVRCHKFYDLGRIELAI